MTTLDTTRTTTPARFDMRRLGDLENYLEEQVESGRIPGISLVLTHADEVLLDVSVGHADLEEQAPIGPDTVFSLYSMTKPLVAVAMLLLHEEGVWHLDDRIDRHLPEFAGLLDLPGNVATRLPTLRETFTHTAGITMGETPEERLEKLLKLNWMTAGSLNEFIGRLARLPLGHDPGTAWSYSFAHDLQAAIVERVSGQRLDLFLRDRVFAPLGMDDTGFAASYEQQRRRARGYVLDPSTDALRPAAPAERLEPIFPMGSTSMFSTRDDYLRFVQMLLRGGALGDVRVLQTESTDLLFANHLAPELMNTRTEVLHYVVGGGNGFGLNGLVCVDPVAAGRPVGRGTYEWGGAFGTFFWADPEHDIACVGMTSRTRTDYPQPIELVAQEIVYDALSR